MELAFKPSFLRAFKKLPLTLQDEVREKIEIFKNPDNHEALKVHKLKGSLAGRLSFSVNYRYRIIFMWEIQSNSAILLTIGDHAIYD